MPESGSDPALPQAPAPAPETRPLVEGEDFYREGPYVVFTAAYHLRRGYCCGSGCRHCPWRDERPEQEEAGYAFQSMSKLSHFDDAGEARMVDVSAKSATRREAQASAFVELNAETLAALPHNPKGNPLEVARIAGIQAAKRTADLIPMCHPLPLSFVDVRTEVVADGITIRATAATTAGTGVEMEAMTAAAVAALTVYDMCKALYKGIVIRDLRLERKTGGKSGHYSRAKSAKKTE